MGGHHASQKEEPLVAMCDIFYTIRYHAICLTTAFLVQPNGPSLATMFWVKKQTNPYQSFFDSVQRLYHFWATIFKQ
jgi:hypothetical protein